MIKFLFENKIKYYYIFSLNILFSFRCILGNKVIVNFLLHSLWKLFKKSSKYWRNSLIGIASPTSSIPMLIRAAKTGRFWISYDDSLTERKDHTSQGTKRRSRVLLACLRYGLVAAAAALLPSFSWIFHSHSTRVSVSFSVSHPKGIVSIQIIVFKYFYKMNYNLQGSAAGLLPHPYIIQTHTHTHTWKRIWNLICEGAIQPTS